MAKFNSNLSGFVNRRSKNPTELNLVSQSEKLAVGGSARLARLGDLKAIAISSIVSSKGIKFGNPSSKSTKGSSGGSHWTGILQNSASGGLANAFGGGLLDLGGLSSIFSGISNLFGGKSTPTPLVQYQQPLPQNQTADINSFGNGKGSENVNSGQAVSNLTQGVYGTGHTTVPFQYQSSQIAQAVKQALLNSSSLNDVIAEIQ